MKIAVLKILEDFQGKKLWWGPVLILLQKRAY